ncbi:MAG: hypothetical protein KDC38_21105 [Planctomycetes bacterium]|nr:hypothetical protein [Planctomycetota bacterium]
MDTTDHTALIFLGIAALVVPAIVVILVVRLRREERRGDERDIDALR